MERMEYERTSTKLFAQLESLTARAETAKDSFREKRSKGELSDEDADRIYGEAAEIESGLKLLKAAFFDLNRSLALTA